MLSNRMFKLSYMRVSTVYHYLLNVHILSKYYIDTDELILMLLNTDLMKTQIAKNMHFLFRLSKRQKIELERKNIA